MLIQFKLWLTLQDQIAALEQWIRKDIARPEQLTRLRSVPGVGPTLGMTIPLESGDIDRFVSVGDYASYCRMVESVRLSNGERKGHGNRKCGNRYLRWAYVEAANHAIRLDPLIRRWYDRKRARKHRVFTIKAGAHKLARACYHMLHEGTPLDPALAGRNLGLDTSQQSEGPRPPASVLHVGPHADRAIKEWASSPGLRATHDAHLDGIRDDR